VSHHTPRDAGPLLLAASAGGHLAQLRWLRPRLAPGGDEPVVWATSAGPQLDELDASDDEVVTTRSIPPRDLLGVIRTLPLAWRTMRSRRPRVVVSTGSAIALAFLPVAAVLGIPAVYIESATRDDGPSLTGRILRWVPRVRLCCQSSRWADSRWRFVGSVLEGFETEATSGSPEIRTAVVTLGTMENYEFRRLVERALAVLPPGTEVLWQTGCTDVSGLEIDGRRTVPAAELRTAITKADVVISHSGTGTALTALELGKCPVLVPRERAHGEHVDDHQAQTAARLSGLGLAVARSVDQLDRAALVEASGRRVVHRADAPPITLPC
jgi:UDP-N-acetylglucosamine--N-acetylmuramyl-(pentapeptide) pyrophosphoryl-undecaprenol N-acetylglucosamine transferase